MGPVILLHSDDDDDDDAVWLEVKYLTLCSCSGPVKESSRVGFIFTEDLGLLCNTHTHTIQVKCCLKP